MDFQNWFTEMTTSLIKHLIIVKIGTQWIFKIGLLQRT